MPTDPDVLVQPASPVAFMRRMHAVAVSDWYMASLNLLLAAAPGARRQTTPAGKR